jgi:NADPH:quinone reductase-like Zn-dependent oxidoreductase
VLAVRFHSFGDPGVLSAEQVPEPAGPVRDQILVQVHASSVNGTDLGLRRGDLKAATLGRMPFTAGFDLAGTVLQCGPAVTAFSPGDRIMALLGHGGGGQAERVVLRQTRAARAPAGCSLTQAAALPLAALTALQALHGKAHLPVRSPGSRVLVVGACGGIGSYAVQLAKLAGAHVTAVASGPKLPYATELGADELIDRTEHDATRLGEQWDVILDTPGTLTLAHARGALAPGGVLVSTRPLSRDALQSLARTPRSRARARFAAVMTQAQSQDLTHLAGLIDTGRLHPTLQRAFPATHAAAAHQHAEGPATGKVEIHLHTASATGVTSETELPPR